MKIWCDVCDKEEASVFCSADEAALCEACDRHVHHANKLANKHSRFNLLSPSVQRSPLCDTCQKRRALIFCKEDRAILCRECDLPIHKANEYTKKHNRFLLTGVKLSASSVTCNNNNDDKDQTEESSNAKILASSSSSSGDHKGGSISTSNISEYFIETLQEDWRIEDFLLDPSSSFVTSTTNVLYF